MERCHGAESNEERSYDYSFFKCSHQENHYDSLVLKQRVRVCLENIIIKPLNMAPVKITKKKCDNLTFSAKDKLQLYACLKCNSFFFCYLTKTNYVFI